ncbi:MAG: hypothetical protein PHV39_02610 [Methanomicrobium sp.]|nr:hypothetical protein [Methanomicrobium sp.]
MQQIKKYLSVITEAVAGSDNNDLIIQLPESTSEMYLAASGEYEKSVTISKRLHYLAVSVPANVVLEIYNDNSLLMWFCDESGTIDLKSGYDIGVMKVKVTNASGDTSARWLCRMIFN